MSVRTLSAHFHWIRKQHSTHTWLHYSLLTEKNHVVWFAWFIPITPPASCLTLCRRCRLNSKGGEHHSGELVNRGSGAWRTSSFPGTGRNTAACTNTDTEAHTLWVALSFLIEGCWFSSCPRWESWLIRQWNIHHDIVTNYAIPMDFSELLINKLI